MRRHKDPSRRHPKPGRQPKRKTTQTQKTPATPTAATTATSTGALHPLRGGAPVTWRCTRYVAVHPLRGGAPEQKRCIAYGSGAAPQQTGTNAELAHRTTHRHTPPCAPGPYWRRDGHAAHATTCTPAHSDTSYTLKCEEPDNLSAKTKPIRERPDNKAIRASPHARDTPSNATRPFPHPATRKGPPPHEGTAGLVNERQDPWIVTDTSRVAPSRAIVRLMVSPAR